MNWFRAIWIGLERFAIGTVKPVIILGFCWWEEILCVMWTNKSVRKKNSLSKGDKKRLAFPSDIWPSGSGVGGIPSPLPVFPLLLLHISLCRRYVWRSGGFSLAGTLDLPRGEIDPAVGGFSLEFQRGGEVLCGKDSFSRVRFVDMSLSWRWRRVVAGYELSPLVLHLLWLMRSFFVVECSMLAFLEPRLGVSFWV